MSDNIQENDMEGILSSIKDILEEDEKQQRAGMASVNSDADNVLDEVLGSAEIDDVLELSPDMRVDSDVDADFADDVLIDVNELLSNDDNQINDDMMEEVSFAETDDNIPMVETEALSEDILPVEDVAVPAEPFFETNSIVEETSVNEPFFDSPEDTSVDMLLDDAVNIEQVPDVFDGGNGNDDLSIDELLGGETIEPVVVEELAPVYEEPVVVEELAPVYEEPAPVYEEPVVVEETAVYDPVIEIEPVVEDVVEEEKQDVSTNIMSNFAKMFSHEENTEGTQITSVGNTSKTLEDLVVDAIQKAIGKEISAKWNNGADFNSFAEAEIRRQVETWIANNMSNVIENVVKKEVERVIAKVSS